MYAPRYISVTTQKCLYRDGSIQIRVSLHPYYLLVIIYYLLVPHFKNTYKLIVSVYRAEGGLFGTEYRQ